MADTKGYFLCYIAFMKMSQIKEQFKDQWVLAKVTKQDDEGQPMEVEHVANAKSKKAIQKKLSSCQDKYVTVIYTGTPKARI